MATTRGGRKGRQAALAAASRAGALTGMDMHAAAIAAARCTGQLHGGSCGSERSAPTAVAVTAAGSACTRAAQVREMDV